MNQNLEKVVVALDYPFPEKAYALVEEIDEAVKWFKVGHVLFTNSGHEVISFLHRKQKNIILDLKLYDTPAVIGETIKQIADLGIRFATVHCAGGKKMLETAAESCRGSQLKLLGVTVLTSEDDANQVEPLVKIATDARLAGIICSPHELKQVRKATLPGFILATPGIRLAGEEVFEDDQNLKRVATPREAVEWGADFLIVGRPITQAREPREILSRLFS